MSELQKIYGIHSGSVHEGGGMGALAYRNIEDAKEDALKLVKQAQGEDDAVYGNKKKGEWVPVKKWKKTTGMNYWSNGIDCISIQKLALK